MTISPKRILRVLLGRYHPSETAEAQSPLHIARNDLYRTTTSAPDQILANDPPLQPSTDAPTSSTHYCRDLFELPVTPPPPNTSIVPNPTLLQTKQVYPSPLLFVRVISNDSAKRQIKYTCQFTNNVTRSNITDDCISPRVLSSYWLTVATKSHQTPHMPRRGRPRKEKGSPDKSTTNSNPNQQINNDNKQQSYFSKQNTKQQKIIRTEQTQRVINRHRFAGCVTLSCPTIESNMLSNAGMTERTHSRKRVKQLRTCANSRVHHQQQLAPNRLRRIGGNR